MARGLLCAAFPEGEGVSGKICLMRGGSMPRDKAGLSHEGRILLTLQVNLIAPAEALSQRSWPFLVKSQLNPTFRYSCENAGIEG